MIRGVIGSVVKMVSYDLTVIANLPGMDEWKFLETASMFKMLSPCEIVTRGHTFVFNTSLLFVLAMTSILFALAVSTQPDLPKDSPLKKSWPSVKAIEYAIRITQDGKGNESFENRNLLFALLALQLNFVNCEQLVAVMEAWLHDRSSSIGDFFVEKLTIDDEQRKLHEALVKRQIEMHGGSVEQSLRHLSSLESDVKERLFKLNDGELGTTLLFISAKTVNPSVQNTSENVARANFARF